MDYIPTAFGQLAFAWKLMNYGLDGKIDVQELDAKVIWVDGKIRFAVPKAFDDPDDLMNALHNNLTITFGAAAITLDSTRDERKIDLPDPIESEQDQCVALIYQIRNAFAHNMAEPTWKIHGRYKRGYDFGGISVDLTDLHGERFDYKQIGGPDVFFRIKDYFVDAFQQEAI